MKNKVLQTGKYILADIVAALLVWVLFFIFRKVYIETSAIGVKVPVEFDQNFVAGFFVLPVFWITLSWFSGYYRDIYRKSRLRELSQTFVTMLIGSVVLFFVLFLDDVVSTYKSYYQSAIAFFLLQFFLTWIFRLSITSYTKYLFRKGKIGFNTLIMGSGKKALEVWEQSQSDPAFVTQRWKGYVPLEGDTDDALAGKLPLLGRVDKIKSICMREGIEEVILAVESTEHLFLQKIITDLDEKNVKVKILPDMYDILSGFVRYSNIFGTPLIEVSGVVMPPWQQSVKRAMDVCVSAVMLVLLMPLFGLLAVLIRLDSPGPVIYKQQRAGRWGKPFLIFKFRSMRVNAEKEGPQLSSDSDNRMTRIGRTMRKFRLDEFPQFYNVLIGDMSLVGPRPERQFYIDQIVLIAPHYKLLQRVKPGITSWGQVKFGYASDVRQMVERLKFDILYIENMSLALDIKIMIYTVLTIIKAEGK